MKKKYTRITAFTIIVIIIFALLTSRLIYIQVLNGDYYKSFAEDIGRKEVVELAPRGEILDKNGNKLATNKQSFNIIYANSKAKRKDEEINAMLISVVRILEKNSNQNKIVLEPLKQISYSSGNYSFNGSDGEIKNFRQYIKDKYRKKINENLDARNIFYKLAEYFALVDEVKPGEYTIKNGLTEDELFYVTTLRVGLKNIGASEYKRMYIAKNVEKRTAMAIEYEKEGLPEIVSIVEPMRYYPYGNIGSLVIGHLGRIYESQAETYKNLNYDASQDLIGQLGLEKALENSILDKEGKLGVNVSLRGENGGRFVQVDKHQRIIGDTAYLEPIPGDSVKTTIDINLQRAADEALLEAMNNIVNKKEFTNATRGAAAVLNVRNGEILALSSKTLQPSNVPQFDPNEYAETGNVSNDRYKQLYPNGADPYDETAKPMYNYATKGAGPPGSTLKPLVAVAGLEEGKITPSDIIVDKGQYRVVPNFPGNCWYWNDYHRTHGAVDVAKALQKSCNYFFYEVGRRLGWDNFSKWVYKFGLAPNPETGEMPASGIEIEETLKSASNPIKLKGYYIDGYMKKLTHELEKQKYGSNSIQYGSEQYKKLRDLLMSGVYDEKKVSELSISNPDAKKKIEKTIIEFNKEATKVYELLFASIGQGTTQLTPLQMAGYISTLVNGGTRYKLHLIKEVLNPDGTVKAEVEPEVYDKIDIKPNNLAAVKEGLRRVTEEGGTASSTFRDFPIQTGGKTGSAQSYSEKDKERLGINRAAYGWFVGFAPYDNPEIAVVVVIYDCGHGGSAAPVARKIYEEYFKKQLQGQAAQTEQNKSSGQ